jgi:hypothetical protein
MPIPASAKPFITEKEKDSGRMRSAFRHRRRPSGAAARARQGSRLRQARGPGRAISTGGARRPLRTLAVSGGQRRPEPRSFPAPCPALRAAGPVARRALRRASHSWPSASVPPEPSGRRGPWSVPAARRAGSGCPGAGAVAGPGSRHRAVRSGRAEAARSGTGLPAAGPRGAILVRPVSARRSAAARS